MCGFVGFTSPKKNSKVIIGRMLNSIAHRGPDGRGIYVDENLALGHARLAIIEPEGGKQPRFEKKNKNVLVFNGEIYGYKKFQDQLIKNNIHLKDSSDTEVLFQLIKKEGIYGAIRQINGMFAFAYKDGKSGNVFLVRDRAGEKPLFYSLQDGILIFASEISGIRKHPLYKDNKIDKCSIAKYLTLQYVPSDESGFYSIRKLPPGHILEFTHGKISLIQYWKPEINSLIKKESDNQQKVFELNNLLISSVKNQLIADVPVGVFLSGGLDSSLIAAIASQCKSDVTAFSMRMPGLTFDETPYAKLAAKYIGIPLEIITFENSEIIDAFDSLISKLDEPFADISLLPTYLLCKATSKKVKVALSGDGADELFGGYPNYRAIKFARIMQNFPILTGKFLRFALDFLGKSEKYMNFNFKLKQLSNGFGLHPNHQNYEWMSIFNHEEQSRLWRNKSLLKKFDINFEKKIKHDILMSNSSNYFDILQYSFLVNYLAENILTKTDRASMYNGLEVRAPYLDKRVIESSLMLNRNEKVNVFDSKLILKQIAKNYLPEEIIYRAKHGFSPPLAKLIRGPLKKRVEDILFSRKKSIEGWFDLREISRYWQEHQSGFFDHHRKIWSLMVLKSIAE
jgi:asparagine synthase (glutamine-hydrolysing)